VIHRLSKRFKTGHLSPPKSQERANASPAAADCPSPQDKADLALQNLKKEAPHTQKAPKPGLFPMIGAAALLGLTGLGLIQGAANLTPPTAPIQTELVTESQSQTQEGPIDLLTPMETSPQMHVAGRQGNLLGAGKILKFDQYPTLRNEELPEQIAGAPNFRQVEDTNVHGVAQPTVDGMRQVLDRLDAKDQTVVWTNMREEPVVYVNGQSFSLRELAHPFENSDDFPGASGEQVERTEQQLKAEVLAEAKANGGKILLHDESGNDVVGNWIEVTPENVRTTREVYQDLQAEGYKVDYARVPVTDEKTPETKDLQALVERVSGAEEGAPLVFNCHAGRGRTTTAMVAAQLLQRAQNPEIQSDFARLDSVRQDMREQGGHYESGNYKLILSLVNSLDNGMASKSETDNVVDMTEDMQNLRTDINHYREKSLSSEEPSGAERAEEKGLDYLHRYHTLITFNQYAKEQAPKGFEVTFEEWLEEHPELTQMLETFELAMRTPTSEGLPGQILPGQESVQRA
jgi:hypothetical protein